MSGLTHFDADGNAAMVDVSDKAETQRIAIAGARVRLGPEAFAAVEAGTAAKGDVLGVARIAGIMAAKRTSDLIPLCHPLPITKVAIDFALDAEACVVAIEATVKTVGQTGVEMEALTAASVAALTVYDMLKAVDKAMVIEDVRLLRKEGGKSGTFIAPDADEPRAVPTPVPSHGRKTRARATPRSMPMPGFGEGVPPPAPPSPPAEIARRIMESRGLRPSAWADAAGVPLGSVYAYLQGRPGSLGAGELERLAKAAHVEIADLLPPVRR